MSSKTMIKWTKQITSSQVEQLIRAEKDIQKAKHIFDSASVEYSNGFRHDHNTFHLMVSRLVSANQFRSAEELLNRMKEEKCKITEDTFLSICRAYGRVHRPLDALRVFNEMKELHGEATQKFYITIFAILVEENQLKIAMWFYKSMRDMGLPPTITSLNVLIKALCKNSETVDAALRIFQEMPNRGCIPDSYTYGTLVNGLCRAGRICEAKELFREMKAKDCFPTVITYTSLISTLCQSKMLDEAMGFLEEMINNGIEPNVFTYSSLMDGFCKDGHSLQAMELFNMMLRKRCMPNMITYTTLIHGLCKEGNVKEALEIFDRMKLQDLTPDASLYGRIINCFCDLHKFHEAANLVDEMVLSKISPSKAAWKLNASIQNAVVQGLSAKSDLNRAFHLYLSMRTRDVLIARKTFDSLVKCCCEKGDLHKASCIVYHMVLDGCVLDEGTWTSLVAEWWDQRDKRMVKGAVKLLLDELTSKFVEPEL